MQEWYTRIVLSLLPSRPHPPFLLYGSGTVLMICFCATLCSLSTLGHWTVAFYVCAMSWVFVKVIKIDCRHSLLTGKRPWKCCVLCALTANVSDVFALWKCLLCESVLFEGIVKVDVDKESPLWILPESIQANQPPTYISASVAPAVPPSAHRSSTLLPSHSSPLLLGHWRRLGHHL